MAMRHQMSLPPQSQRSLESFVKVQHGGHRKRQYHYQDHPSKAPDGKLLIATAYKAYRHRVCLVHQRRHPHVEGLKLIEGLFLCVRPATWSLLILGLVIVTTDVVYLDATSDAGPVDDTPISTPTIPECS